MRVITWKLTELIWPRYTSTLQTDGRLNEAISRKADCAGAVTTLGLTVNSVDNMDYLPAACLLPS